MVVESHRCRLCVSNPGLAEGVSGWEVTDPVQALILLSALRLIREIKALLVDLLKVCVWTFWCKWRRVVGGE